MIKSNPKTKAKQIPAPKKEEIKQDKSELFKGYVEYPDTAVSRGLFLTEKIDKEYTITLNGKTVNQGRLDIRLINELKDLGAIVKMTPVPGLKGKTRIENVPIHVAKRPETITKIQKDGTPITLKEGDLMIRVNGKSMGEVDSKTKQIQMIVIKTVGATLPPVYVCTWGAELDDELELLDDSEIPRKFLPVELKKARQLSHQGNTVVTVHKEELEELIVKAKKYDDLRENDVEAIKGQLRKTRIDERKVELDVLR